MNSEFGLTHRFGAAYWVEDWWDKSGNSKGNKQRHLSIEWTTDKFSQFFWAPQLLGVNSVQPGGLVKDAGALMVAEDGTIFRSVRMVDKLQGRFDFEVRLRARIPSSKTIGHLVCENQVHEIFMIRPE